MSHPLISRSADLQQLQNAGYELSIRGGKLLVGHVPFRDANGHVAYGTLVSDLTLAGEVTAPPQDHVARFIGGVPHRSNGEKMHTLIADEAPQQIEPGLSTTCTFSQKLTENGAMRPYRNYYEQITTYIGIVNPRHWHSTRTRQRSLTRSYPMRTTPLFSTTSIPRRAAPGST